MTDLRLTWFDILLVAVLVTIAFLVGRAIRGQLVEVWFPPAAELSNSNAHVELLRAKESLQTVQTQLDKVRGQIADEDTAQTIANANLPHATGEKRAKLQADIDTHRLTIDALRDRSTALIRELADTETQVNRAQRVDQESLKSKQNAKKWRDWLILVGASFATLAALTFVFLLLRWLARLSVHSGVVLVLSASLLFCFLIAESLGWIAAFAGVLVVTAVVAGRKPA